MFLISEDGLLAEETQAESAAHPSPEPARAQSPATKPGPEPMADAASISGGISGGTSGGKKRRKPRANRKRDRSDKQNNQPAGQIVTVRPIAAPAHMKRHHWGLLLSFLLLVIVPCSAVYWYLEVRAVDQFASTVGFSIRSEDAKSPVDILGGLSNLTSGSTSDSDILYEFIQSQELVQRIDQRLDLRTIWSKAKADPVFAFDSSKSLEDLVNYWGRMVNISYDGGTRLIQVRVLAFDAQDARAIAREITAESSTMINRLSAIARDDATRYAKEDLTAARTQLKTARQAVTSFRTREQIVDPNADIQSQMGLIGSLQKQLADSLIALDLLHDSTRDSDPRIRQAERRIEVIQTRIADERQKFGVGTRPESATGQGDVKAYGNVVSEYEGLIVEREFSEKTYLSALSAFEGAKANAQRQSRYLAAYIGPTLAQTAEYPRRLMIAGLVTLFLVLAWSIMTLIYYSIRDRR